MGEREALRINRFVHGHPLTLRLAAATLSERPDRNLEFGVLECLLDREGQAVTRASLIQDVWGHSYTGGSNVIEAVVRSLRKKLRERAACVETVSGVGYRFRSG